ncbi:hypothetical protein [Campylobacter helveticus]|uniref:hypothetical protein n=1 Tax=Campylobacter helveticus TaxID=28898 RepID=UPI001F0FFE72|nr:hypothetical protein [Campylobacter helveticus]
MPYQNNAQRSAYTKTESNTKRNYISSGNFKKSTSFQVFHNANIRPDYAIGGEIICNLNGYEALELKNKIIAEAKEAYEKNKKPKAPSFKAKSYEWSLVVNLKPESTMQDLEKLAQHFSDKYGFQCYQIAIHRDEVIEILFQESLPQEKKFTKEKIAKEKIRITINQSKKVRELFTETIKTRIQINTLKEIKNTIFKRF